LPETTAIHTGCTITTEVDATLQKKSKYDSLDIVKSLRRVLSILGEGEGGRKGKGLRDTVPEN